MRYVPDYITHPTPRSLATRSAVRTPGLNAALASNESVREGADCASPRCAYNSPYSSLSDESGRNAGIRHMPPFGRLSCKVSRACPALSIINLKLAKAPPPPPPLVGAVVLPTSPLHWHYWPWRPFAVPARGFLLLPCTYRSHPNARSLGVNDLQRGELYVRA